MLQTLAFYRLKRLLSGWWNAWQIRRQSFINRVLSSLYTQPVQVLPQGQVNLSAILVLWLVTEHGRHVITIRPNKHAVCVRFPAVVGMAGQPDMAQALQATLPRLLGSAFTRSLEWSKLTLSHVAAAPVTLTTVMPGQLLVQQQLVWVQHISPLQLELLQPAPGSEVLVVPETALNNPKIAREKMQQTIYLDSLHRQVMQSIQRHLPQRNLALPAESAAPEEDPTKPAATRQRPPRVVH